MILRAITNERIQVMYIYYTIYTITGTHRHTHTHINNIKQQAIVYRVGDGKAQ